MAEQADTPRVCKHPIQRKACGAKTRDGGACKAWAMTNGRCRMHGGASLSGLASPTVKTGRYSKVLPVRLAARYHEAQADPELLAMRDEIALVDARLEDLLKRVDTGESGRLWQRLQATNNELLEAQRDRDSDAMAKALTALTRQIKQGAADYAAWAEIGQVIEQRRKIVESERKRLLDLQQVITTEQAIALVTMLVSLIRENVTDKNALRAISAGIDRLMCRQDARRLES